MSDAVTLPAAPAARQPPVRQRRTRADSRKRWRALGLLTAVGALNLLPLYYMFASSLAPSGPDFVAGRLSPPTSPAWGNYVELFSNRGFGRMMLNSVIATSVSVLCATLIAILAAYSFTRMKGRLSSVLFTFVVSMIAVPPIVVLVPLFLLGARVGLINHLAGPILIYVGFLLPFSVLMLRSFFETIPQEVLEACRVDGASALGEIRHVVIPMSLPAIASLAVINALWVWNELLIAIVFLQDDSLRTLQPGIAFFSGRNVSDIPLTMAGAAVATLPILVLFLFAQKALGRGLTGGALK
jgi:ABC-type glycerol-3-phosphate transport system permease component